MYYEFKLKIEAKGNFTEEDLKNYIGFESGAICEIYCDNPFVDEKNDAEIISIEIE